MSDKIPAYLLIPSTGRVMIYTEAQWRKPETIACDAEGTPLKGFSKPDLGKKRTTRLADRRATPDDIPEGAPAERIVPARVDTAEPTVDPEAEARDNEAKAKLVKFAKDRFGVTLDPNDALKVIEARVNKLASTATPAGQGDAPAAKAKPAKRVSKPKPAK